MSSSTESVESRPRKHFIPLESNPELFTELMCTLGVSDSLCFQDVLSLNDPELLAFLPRPVHALVLVFPDQGSYRNSVTEENKTVAEYEASGDKEDVVFFKQTIHNACGLYGILHATCNGVARSHIEPDSTLARLLAECTPLPSEARARALENNSAVESAYAAIASRGDTAAPAAEDEVDFHYICFIRSSKSGRLYLLDGDRKRPFDFGKVGGDDVLSGECLSSIKGFIEGMKGESIGFSLMALVPAWD
ncbi:cysteine proteinase [Delitschia confertaspora ATCC 74209]|uniref:Ubiquitin carboxyl-terminal hydrolase n=1 Tax=Delitschia confertaspora ATCC 74209 TaxID=1513339 RepID=A0A9P4MR30_9PLEO|nr:cysteine proteinase [Delitschia confertaspora ATCC 74209]